MGNPGSTNVTDLIFPVSVPIWDAWNAPLPNPKIDVDRFGLPIWMVGNHRGEATF
jgi:hypothetical protein